MSKKTDILKDEGFWLLAIIIALLAGLVIAISTVPLHPKGSPTRHDGDSIDWFTHPASPISPFNSESPMGW